MNKHKAMMEHYDEIMVQLDKEQMRHLEECKRHVEQMGRLYFQLSKVRAFLFDGARRKEK